MYKPEVECFDEPLTIRQTDETSVAAGRSYTGFLKSLFGSGSATNQSNINSGGAAAAPSSPGSALPTEKITDIELKGMKGNSKKLRFFSQIRRIVRNRIIVGMKEITHVIYSSERGKLETVLLKPGAGVNQPARTTKGCI